jgi:hypothetical protein
MFLHGATTATFSILHKGQFILSSFSDFSVCINLSEIIHPHDKVIGSGAGEYSTTDGDFVLFKEDGIESSVSKCFTTTPTVIIFSLRKRR